MRLAALVAWAAVAIWLGAGTNRAETRAALVIGNGSYPAMPQFARPGSNSGRVDKTLRDPAFATASMYVALESCRPRADRLLDARNLLNAIPATTPLDTIPRAILIWYRTEEPGVVLSPRVRSEHPKDIAIILEHQYRNLNVTADSIVVTVSFKGISETLVIPWSAVIMVTDKTAGIDIDLRQCP